MQYEISRFPEWKALYDVIVPLIDSGQTDFSYDELNAIAKLDVREPRGRTQFYRFRKELLRNRQLWLECVPTAGYVVLPAKEHPQAAFKRIRQAKRKVNLATDINKNVRLEQLTPEQRMVQATASAVLYELSKTFYSAGRKFRIASKQSLQMPVDVPKLLETVAGKTPSKPIRSTVNSQPEIEITTREEQPRKRSQGAD